MTYSKLILLFILTPFLVVLLFLLREEQEVYSAGEYWMHKESTGTQFDRYENKEVICYEGYRGNLQCKWKMERESGK